MYPAADRIGVGSLEGLDQGSEPVRADVNVVVHEREMRPLRAVYAAVACMIEPLLGFLRVAHLDRKLAAEPVYGFRRIVTGVVVDDQYLPIEPLDALLSREGGKARRQVLAAIERADDDREIHSVPLQTDTAHADATGIGMVPIVRGIR